MKDCKGSNGLFFMFEEKQRSQPCKLHTKERMWSARGERWPLQEIPSRTPA